MLPVPEASAAFKSTLHIPMLIENGTSAPQEITLIPVLPKGWIDESHYSKFKVEAGESYPLQAIIRARENGPRQWEELSWNAEVDGHPVGAVKLRVYVGKGSALPQ